MDFLLVHMMADRMVPQKAVGKVRQMAGRRVCR